MIANIQSDIKELEGYVGFPIKRREITFESNEPHDEIFSYGLCQEFYGRDEELKIAIKKVIEIIIKLTNQSNKNDSWKKEISLFFSLLGDMYYLSSDFTRSINCFMKSLSYNKTDITNWVGLMFSFRASGKIDIFEELIFNFEDIYSAWKKDTCGEMDQKKIYELTK